MSRSGRIVLRFQFVRLDRIELRSYSKGKEQIWEGMGLLRGPISSCCLCSPTTSRWLSEHIASASIVASPKDDVNPNYSIDGFPSHFSSRWAEEFPASFRARKAFGNRLHRIREMFPHVNGELSTGNVLINTFSAYQDPQPSQKSADGIGKRFRDDKSYMTAKSLPGEREKIWRRGESVRVSKASTTFPFKHESLASLIALASYLTMAPDDERKWDSPKPLSRVETYRLRFQFFAVARGEEKTFNHLHENA